MNPEEPNEEDLKKIRTEIEPKSKGIIESLEFDPETLEEMMKTARKLNVFSNVDMFTPIGVPTNYQCNAIKDCASCLLETCPTSRMPDFPTPTVGKIHHPPIRMPIGNYPDGFN